MDQGESRLRVFISYSHDDGDEFAAVCEALRAAGAEPWSDANIAAGRGFTHQIQSYIAHAHVFVPILTPRSHARGWVHQEIGFAVAMKVPCVPICIGQLPDGMIAMEHAIVASGCEAVADAVAGVDFKGIVEEAGLKWVPPTECADEPEDRAEMIEGLADGARRAISHSCVRCRGGLSSFSIPDAPADDPIWAQRYGRRPRSPGAYALFRRERQALAKHAAVAGLKMIINIGVDLDSHYGEGVKKTRVRILLESLENLPCPDERVRIAVVEQDEPYLIAAVGDWFIGESRAARPVRGVLQTVFTVHAPTVRHRTIEFDQVLTQRLRSAGVLPAESKAAAMSRLRAFLGERA